MNYFEVYKDIWNFHKKYIDNISDNDDFWQEVIDESNVISKKYGDCKFIINLLLAEMTEFERICKEMSVDANTAV